MRFLGLRTALCLVLFVWTSSARNTSFVNTAKSKLRILGVFGHLGKSHFDAFLPILEELARRGHDVTVLSFYPRTEEAKAREPLPNYKDITLHDGKGPLFLDVVDLTKVDQSVFRVINELKTIRRMADVACEAGLKKPEIGQFMKSEQRFDVILTENFNTDCFLSIVHRFKAPYLSLSSHNIMPWANSRIGNPHEVSYNPVIFEGLKRPLDFVGRLINSLTMLVTTNSYETWFHSVDQAIAEEAFGPGLPDLKEVGRNMTALLVNTHHSLHGARPHLPNVVEIGGIHIPASTKPLPKDIAKFLDEATEGVLYFNLGSMVKASSMSNETVSMLLKVIGSIPRKVIWKWESPDLPNKPDNLMIKKWLPQFDILSHPNVRCYFGHGGGLGLSEGVYNGVPMVLTPVFGDQFNNAAAAEARGVAIVIKYLDLTEQNLRQALDDMFNNTRYRENARKLSKAYRDRPVGPLETAVWWTEHIGRGHGLPYLKSDGANLAWYQRHLVDVALFLLLGSLALLYLVHRLARSLLPSLIPARTKPNTSGGRGKSKKRD